MCLKRNEIDIQTEVEISTSYYQPLSITISGCHVWEHEDIVILTFDLANNPWRSQIVAIPEVLIVVIVF